MDFWAEKQGKLRENQWSLLVWMVCITVVTGDQRTPIEVRWPPATLVVGGGCYEKKKTDKKKKTYVSTFGGFGVVAFGACRTVVFLIIK